MIKLFPHAASDLEPVVHLLASFEDKVGHSIFFCSGTYMLNHF